MLITISGPPGSGKSTVAGAVSDAFGLEHISGGDIFRSLASERGLSVVEFNELAESDESIDRELDMRLREIARSKDSVVLESRLSGWMAGEYADIKIWLDAPLSVRADRIAAREEISVSRAARETRVREESEKKRYHAYYGIDFDDRSIYDLGINTARWDAESVSVVVNRAIEAFDEDSDEGTFDANIDIEF